MQDDDFISFILNGLDSSFGIFKVALDMRSGTITPEELFGLLLREEEESLAEDFRSTTTNTQFGATPSHALLTYNYPAPSLNVNQSSILGPPHSLITLLIILIITLNLWYLNNIPIPLDPIIVGPNDVCNVKYVVKIIMMHEIVIIAPMKKIFHLQGKHLHNQFPYKHILLLLQLLLILRPDTLIRVLHIMANLSSQTYTGNDGLAVGNGMKIFYSAY